MLSARFGAKCGVLGVTIVEAAATLTAAVFRGRAGETYSPLNHFVSELGHARYSAWGMLFNIGLILGNACMIPFTLAVARRLGGKAGWVFGVLGLISNLSGALVGFTPMNILVPHLLVAFVFFYACLASIALFTVHSLLVPRGSGGRWIAVPGLFSLACFTVFLGDCIRLRHDLHGVVHNLSHRPSVWLLPLSEWCVFLSILLWITLVAMQLKTEASQAELSAN